jgi:hypothetical protein
MFYADGYLLPADNPAASGLLYGVFRYVDYY